MKTVWGLMRLMVYYKTVGIVFIPYFKFLIKKSVMLVYR